MYYFALNWVGGRSLCLDPPFSSFVDRLTSLIYVEASQVDFSLAASGLCDSTEGPLCPLLMGSSQPLTTMDLFSQTLGIPQQISVSISSGEVDIGQLAVTHKSRRLVRTGEPGWDTQSVPVRGWGFSKISPVGFAGPGWFDSFGTILLDPRGGQDFGGRPSIVFNEPLVVQTLALHDCGLLVGKLRGIEQWRRDDSSILGNVVFAKWGGNGAIFRGKVVFDEGSSVTVSWADGDASYRQVNREDIVSIVPGRSENLYAIDEIEFVFGEATSVCRLEELIVSETSGGSRKLIRSGGGMVFQDIVSEGAILYNVNDLIERKWKLRNSEETRRKFHAYLQPGKSTTVQAQSTYSSQRNIVLLWMWSELHNNMSQSKLVQFVLNNITLENTSQFLNLNDLTNALIDKTPDTYASMYVFQTWLKTGGASTRGAIAGGDKYEGVLTCMSGAIVFKLEIISFSENSVAVRIKFGANVSTMIQGKWFPNFGMIQIPNNQVWTHPISLFLFKSNDTFTIEIVGTGNEIGCGTVIMTPIYLNDATRESFKNVQVQNNVSQLKTAFLKFNNLLIKAAKSSQMVYPRR